jgi:hypothetical protein
MPDLSRGMTFTIACTLGALLLSITCLSACDDSTDPSAEAFNASIDQLNALSGPDLTFEGRLVDDGRVRAAVPVGWVSGPFDRLYRPNQADLFDDTSFSVSLTCDGGCQARDWAASFEVNHVASNDPATIAVQETLTNPAGKLIITRREGRAEVVVGRWRDGAPTYLYCYASLRGDDLRFEDAFKLACLSAQALSFSNVVSR